MNSVKERETLKINDENVDYATLISIIMVADVPVQSLIEALDENFSKLFEF